MGEFADYALDEMMDVDELQQRHDSFESAVTAGVEESLYDYDGTRLPHVFSGNALMPNVTTERPRRRTRRTTTKESPKPSGRILGSATTQDEPLKDLYFIHGKPGIGKTSFCAYAPKPIFFIDKLEKGVLKLRDMKNSPIPQVPVAKPFESWDDVHDGLNELRAGDHDFETLIIDSITGLEKLLFQHVADQEFDGKLTKDGFFAFQQGPDTVMTYYWPRFFQLLEEVRESGIDIFIIGHSQITMFNSPTGANYDRWEPVLHKKSWKAIDRIMDNVMFMDYHISLEQVGHKKKPKADQESSRLIRTEPSPAYDAKNRLGLPSTIDMGDSPEEAWTNFERSRNV